MQNCEKEVSVGYERLISHLIIYASHQCAKIQRPFFTPLLLIVHLSPPLSTKSYVMIKILVFYVL